MAGRLLEWWRVAQVLGATLTRPRIDSAAADAAVYDAIAGSRLFAWGARCVTAGGRAWADSMLSTSVRQLRRSVPGAPADRIRFAARCAAVAAITVLILLPLGTSSGRGFQAIVPIGVLLAALAATRSADVLSRAWLDGRA